jgi:NAD(P)H-hydrate repair Nnr-like enzyme with NAD(P)H-hydrate dehydratase domain
MAVALASFIHAAAGDYYREFNNEVTLTASDLIDTLPFVLSNNDYEFDED